MMMDAGTAHIDNRGRAVLAADIRHGAAVLGVHPGHIVLGVHPGRMMDGAGRIPGAVGGRVSDAAMNSRAAGAAEESTGGTAKMGAAGEEAGAAAEAAGGTAAK